MSMERDQNSPKRTPKVLVTDSREPYHQHNRHHRPSQGMVNPSPSFSSAGGNRPSSKLVSLDNVLSHATSDVPSMQARVAPGAQASSNHGRKAAAATTAAATTGGMRSRLLRSTGIPTANSKSGEAGGGAGVTGQAAKTKLGPMRSPSRPLIPPRSTKVTEKLVLLPETVPEEEESGSGASDGETADGGDDDDGAADDNELVFAPGAVEGAPPQHAARRAPGHRNPASFTLHEGAAHKRSFAGKGKGRAVGGDFDVDNESAPLLAEEEAERRRHLPAEKAKSYAERLPKARRAEKLPRVTAYCTGQAYRLRATADFIKTHHSARTKLYDDCLYAAYHLPLLPGREGYRLRSSPAVKNAVGKTMLDEQIERNERSDYHEAPFEDQHAYEHSVATQETTDENRRRTEGEDEMPSSSHDRDGSETDKENVRNEDTFAAQDAQGPGLAPPFQPSLAFAQTPTRIATNVLDFAELYVFSYGVVVFWNFTEHQEKDILADLSFYSINTSHQLQRVRPRSNTPVNASFRKAPALDDADDDDDDDEDEEDDDDNDDDNDDESISKPPVLTLPLVVNPLSEEDFETEEFHFDYSTEISRPRVYNDMITLRSGDHMIKLAISHGIAQSTKLSFFEEVMARQMDDAKDVPKRLALTGKLGMKRDDVYRILGRLFKSRVEVNLSSNVLDVPNFFWDSEPTLHPLYSALREYLEIKPRIQVLNERCRVFLDLAEMLSDSMADSEVSRQTWIVIVLIVISILITVSEVVLRFGILTRSGGPKGSSLASAPSGAAMLGGGSANIMDKQALLDIKHVGGL